MFKEKINKTQRLIESSSTAVKPLSEIVENLSRTNLEISDLIDEKKDLIAELNNEVLRLDATVSENERIIKNINSIL